MVEVLCGQFFSMAKTPGDVSVMLLCFFLAVFFAYRNFQYACKMLFVVLKCVRTHTCTCLRMFVYMCNDVCMFG